MVDQILEVSMTGALIPRMTDLWTGSLVPSLLGGGVGGERGRTFAGCWAGFAACPIFSGQTRIFDGGNCGTVVRGI